MHRTLLLLSILLSAAVCEADAQDTDHVFLDTMSVSVNALHSRYQPSRERTIDMEHMRLEIVPDLSTRRLKGRCELQARPYRYPVDRVELDAKGMLIHAVQMQLPDGFIPLAYTYDDLLLSIMLPRSYDSTEQFVLTIDYTARPYELEENGIELSSGRGVYFIDPMDHNPVKPTQMWSQGETISNSVWFPVVDAPNDPLTHEILLTVDAEYVTLSNGILTGSQSHPDGTRTDHWEMLQPHGPHLIMIAAGDFHIEREFLDSLELTYYSTEEYAPYVRDIFRNTSDMIRFYEELFREKYPWDKYGQMVVYDYTSGAMENTTAVIFYEAYYADLLELLDRDFDETIAHEIVHQWFGNLVACESWAHLALNEAFATYGEYLWFDHAEGRDAADKLQYQYLFTYLAEFIYKSEPIINYYYDDPENLFDAHRYEKGSWVLHMLRDYLGDAVFFDGLARYLDRLKFGTAEIHDLRLIMESVSGKDLYWFFEQWFMKPGHPVVDISKFWNRDQGRLDIAIRQRQDLERYGTFRFPLSIDIYYSDTVIRENVWVDERTEHIRLKAPEEPKFVNVDAKKILLWDKSEERSVEECIHQFYNAPLYVDRMEAINALNYHQALRPVRKLHLDALDDPFWHIRQHTLQALDLHLYEAAESSIDKVRGLALNDPSSVVRKAALQALEALGPRYVIPVAENLFGSDSSRLVRSAALDILYKDAPELYFPEARLLDRVNNVNIKDVVSRIYADRAGPEGNGFYQWAIWSTRPYHCGSIIERYVAYLERMDRETLQNAAEFLTGIALHEESSYLRNLAENALYDLREFFRRSDLNDREERQGILDRALEELEG